MIILRLPVPLILRMMSVFYLWVYARGVLDGTGLTTREAP